MDSKQNRKIIALLFVGVLMGALDISIVGPALPSIERALNLDVQFTGWIFSIYVLFNLIGVSLFARLSDIHGRRKIYILAVAIFGLGSLWVALSHNFSSLLIGRAVQGFGASGIFPVASALVGDLYPPEKRGQILGIIGAVFGLAFLMGPFIAGILLKFYSWNVLFTINIPITILLIYFSNKLIPSVPSKKIKSIDWMGIMMLGFCLATLTYGLNTLSGISTVFNWENALTIAPFLLALASFLFLVRVEKRAEFPIVELSFFQNRQIVIAGLLAISTGVMQACFVFIPKFVVESFSVASSTASFMLTPFVLATAFGSPIFGKMIDRFGVKIIVIIGLLLSASGFFLLSASGSHKALYYSSGVLIGLGMSVLSGSSLRYIILNNTSEDDRATSQGMLTIFISLGQLIATALIGVISATLMASQGYTSIFMATAMLLVGMVFLAFGLKNQLARVDG
ncbi:MAG: MFS transporter [Candidatus Marinimicrobia bacterium]|nr:MFS transporter [Candidatus Neomarinimicrobiota bacterium]